MSAQFRIDELKGLNFTETPPDHIKNIMKRFEPALFSTIFLPKGTIIFRFRPNELNGSFNNISEITYKKAEDNDNYGRAHRPNTTMFYGCVALIRDNTENDVSFSSATNTIIGEFSKINKEIRVKKLTLSQWKLKSDITLIPMIYKKDYEINKRYIENYQKRLEENPQYKENSNLITDYFASEFAKEVQQKADYLISALFTEAILENGLAGVFYPSVQTNGTGYNVAIAPDFVDKYLIPTDVWEGTLNKDTAVLDLDKEVKMTEGKKEFELIPLADDNHIIIKGKTNANKF